MTSLDLTQRPETDPAGIYRYRESLYAADLLTAAVCDLNIFTQLASKPSDIGTICHDLGIMERPTDVMLTLLQAMGLIVREGATFHVTQTASEHLVEGSPWCVRPYFASMKDRPVCRDFLTVLRTGRPASWASLKDEQAWEAAMEKPEFAKQFTAAMDCRGIYLGQGMAERFDFGPYRRVLDIAGGSGIYACSLVAHYPHLKTDVLEKPPVDRIARDSIADRGFSESVGVVASDMFRDSFPSNHDVHLFSNVLHDWDFQEVERLLQTSYEALPSGGLLVIHDAHINDAKDGPLPVAEYSTLLMAITEGKCYATSEMTPLLSKTGFQEVSFIPSVADRSLMIAKKG